MTIERILPLIVIALLLLITFMIHYFTHRNVTPASGSAEGPE